MITIIMGKQENIIDNYIRDRLDKIEDHVQNTDMRVSLLTDRMINIEELLTKIELRLSLIEKNTNLTRKYN